MIIRGSDISVRVGALRCDRDQCTVALGTDGAGAYAVTIVVSVFLFVEREVHYWAMTDPRNALISLASYHEAVEHYTHLLRERFPHGEVEVRNIMG